MATSRERYDLGGTLPLSLSSVLGGPSPERVVPPPSERITRRRVRPRVWMRGQEQEPPPFRDDGCVDPCPECAVGKHGNCDGTALDQERDQIVRCPCRSAGHP